MSEPDARVDEARARGVVWLEQQIAAGVLVDGPAASRALGVLAPILGDALVSIDVNGQPHYLATSLHLPAGSVIRINRALGTASPGQRLLWWMRTHGALGGSTVPQAIVNGHTQRCIELAEAWADEHGTAR